MTFAPLQWLSRLLVAVLVLLVRIYQVTLGPLINAFGPVCRFQPTCSRYMIGALQKYGPIKGLWKGTGRLLRCHPWNPGGLDPP